MYVKPHGQCLHIYADLSDDSKELIAKYVYGHLCRGISGHYLDVPVSSEMREAGIGSDCINWAESGDSEMVLCAIERV